MELLALWEEKHKAGGVRFDPELLVFGRADADGIGNEWGTLYYSQAREIYKSEVEATGTANSSFDLDLMSRMEIGRFAGQIIAANPNSLFPGHLVIYPADKHVRLTVDDVSAITHIAANHPDYTFIHNMERSAASIVDWVHFQGYARTLPINGADSEMVTTTPLLSVYRLTSTYPAFGIIIRWTDADAAIEFVTGICERFYSDNNPRKQPVAFNLIFTGTQIAVFPRSGSQSELAASYFGALEFGGLFCLPNADRLREYLPASLRREIADASVWNEPEMVHWLVATARELSQ